MLKNETQRTHRRMICWKLMMVEIAQFRFMPTTDIDHGDRRVIQIAGRGLPADNGGRIDCE